MRVNLRTISAIGALVVVLSLVIFSASVFSISRDTNVYSISLNPGESENISRYAGLNDYITYRITFINLTQPLSSYLISPSGSHSSGHGIPINTTGSLVADESGPWSLFILNTGNRTVYLTVEYTVVPEGIMYAIIAAFTLLPIGIVIIILNPLKNRIDKWRKRRQKI
ncbi:hypothetical protein [Thermoplasma sp.]|uniref:hypothetical protein n=1 Tax=Thermoplasma sp. TaxID=1973142 RepID=UPI0012823882|nr:hypothetical protein [Thermoplasma sp.]KAA8922390.1 MAG: hypothetical protein F6Q11_04645 [Thermoplasma sp.]